MPEELHSSAFAAACSWGTTLLLRLDCQLSWSILLRRQRDGSLFCSGMFQTRRRQRPRILLLRHHLHSSAPGITGPSVRCHEGFRERLAFSSAQRTKMSWGSQAARRFWNVLKIWWLKPLRGPDHSGHRFKRNSHTANDDSPAAVQAWREIMFRA